MSALWGWNYGYIAATEVPYGAQSYEFDATQEHKNTNGLTTA